MLENSFVSICISSYNRADIITECIKSLIDLNFPKNLYEIIIIDNNSQDETVSKINKLKNNLSNKNIIKLVSLKKNVGSSGSFLEALKHLNNNWTHILKMDEDVILDKNCLLEMVKMSEHVAIKGIIGGQIRYHKDKKLIQAIGSKLHPIFAIAKGIGVNADASLKIYKNSRSIDAPNGCMILIPREIYENVSWFYLDYFIYYDDHEIMFRAKNSGYLNYYCSSAVAFHDTSTGSRIKYSNDRWLYYSVRNSLFFLKRNFKQKYIDFILYFLAHNFKFFIGIFFIFYFSKSNKILNNIYNYFLGYYHGVIGLGGKYK